LIWAVLDTNVLVSGLGWSRSLPGRIVNRALQGRFVLVTSKPLLDELERVLAFPRLAGVIGDPGELVGLISEVAVIVEPDRELTVIRNDPADNRVLEAAVAANADYIVSGDSHLLEIGVFEGTRIVTARAFIAG
jgi:uncharacterized protein